jgi:methylamine--corrinoid protein Co-methyltransferase
MIGGYSGGVEESVIVANAGSILQAAVHQGSIIGGVVYDLGSYSGSSRAALWANSVAIQGQSRNTHIIAQGVVNAKAGPCTDMLLYEAAAQCIAHVASGAGWVVGVSARESKYPEYSSGLENKFASELTKRCMKISRVEANSLVNKLLDKYEAQIQDAPPGKRFRDCTDLHTLQPTKEWYDIYLKVREDLIDLGAPADLWTWE